MPRQTSIASFPDIINALDRAIASEKGIRLTFDVNQDRVNFLRRFHSFRLLDRRENAKVYPADHPLHGHSAYDCLGSRKPKSTDGKFLVEIFKLESVEYNVEDIE